MWKIATFLRSLSLLAGLAILAIPASAVDIDWVFIEDPDNAPDAASNCFARYCGSVSYPYSISAYEITNAQYAEFLNAKARTDPLGLYNTNMSTNPQGGITRSFIPGSFVYAAKPGFENKPVNFVSFYDALRFTNWLNNFQGDGDTESGAYTLLGGTATPSNGATVLRNAGANVALPSENEWYKAAYYQADGPVGPFGPTYYHYPAGSDAETVCSDPTGTPNRANCGGDAGGLTDVGVYTGTASPWGTFDQGGNVWEWNEEILDGGSQRGRRGGDFNGSAGFLAASDPRDSSPTVENAGIGFRVVSPLASSLFGVSIDKPRNAPDTLSHCFAAACGSVPYNYGISAFEVTNVHYAEFLNAKARGDPFDLYNPLMTTGEQGGIDRSGSAGSFTYVVKPGFAFKPVNYVSFYDALRFANWLQNGGANGDTEHGSYTLFGGLPIPSNGTSVVRNADAFYVLPSENEWYKAAYYDPRTSSYFDYPAGSNTQTLCSDPTGTPNHANCGGDSGGLTVWGAYTGSQSPFGTYDQGGNVWEWNEEIVDEGAGRGRRGGSFGIDASFLAASERRDSSPTLETGSIGFRLAFLVPEPGSVASSVAALAALGALRGRRGNSCCRSPMRDRCDRTRTNRFH